MKTVLPDSSIVIDLFNGVRDAAPKLAEADRIFVSPIVLGEVRAGFGDTRRDRAAKDVHGTSSAKQSDTGPSPSLPRTTIPMAIRPPVRRTWKSRANCTRPGGSSESSCSTISF